jgi:Lar family restriction alleviation protein
MRYNGRPDRQLQERHDDLESKIKELESKLNPCPFCGSRDNNIKKAKPTGYQVMCNHCEARGPRTDTKENAQFAWEERK